MTAGPDMGASPVKPGDMLAGKYRVEKLLGMGNMGVVVAATHVALKQRVALKFMLPTKAAGQEQYARFLREAQAAVRLRTQHVARVSDVGTLASGAPYMVMELLDGRDLAAVLHERGPLPVAEAVDYILQACEAVAEAHACGIVHRDIKPANLFLARGLDGKPCVKVLDFGISKHRDEVKLTQEEAVLGSPLYMSPEQIRSSGTVDARSDVWALGVVLYELVAGQTPFHADRIMELVTKVSFEPPSPLTRHRPDAPPGFEAILRQCFEKDRERRLPSVAALAAALVPFGSVPYAAMYAERVAAVLGEEVAPARPTALFVPEVAIRAQQPSLAAGAGTADALTRSSMTMAPARPAQGWRVAGGALALGLVAVGGFWAGRGRAPLGPAVSASGASSTPGAISAPPAEASVATTTNTSASPSATAQPPAASADATPVPTASTSAPPRDPSPSPAFSGTVAPAASIPKPKGSPTQRFPVSKAPAALQPAPTSPASPSQNLYDRGTKR